MEEQKIYHANDITMFMLALMPLSLLFSVEVKMNMTDDLRGRAEDLSCQQFHFVHDGVEAPSLFSLGGMNTLPHMYYHTRNRVPAAPISVLLSRNKDIITNRRCMCWG